MVKIGRPRTTKGLAAFCGKIAQEKLADKILILDLSAIETAPADYFVICTCESDIQLKSLADRLSRKCKELKMDKPRIEGLAGGYWVLMDFFDVVMHIMLPDARNFYQLEKLWGDAKFMRMDDQGKLISFNSKNFKYD
ncbi:ribosome silencing factor [Bacteroidota bacterium]